MFCLISLAVSPDFPPEAADGLLTVNEAKILLAVAVVKLLFKKVAVVINLLILFAATFELTPPPVKYLTVKVVLTGATP